MEPVLGNIKTSRTARYFMLGDNTLPVKTLIIVLHGYGMEAKEFVQEFASLVKPGVIVVAPEGLSRFYRKGFTGTVVASWMTREDRLNEIEDYVSYLDNLYSNFNPDGKINTILLGFSQGASTASRWIAKGNGNFSALVLWCGEFARDENMLISKFPVIRHVFATKDEFITLSQYEKQSRTLLDLGASVYDYKFEGGHVIDQSTLATVFEDAGL